MAITTAFLTGFEHGFLGTGANAGGGLIDVLPASWSISTSSPRNGSYCAHLVAPSGSSSIMSKTLAFGSQVIARFAVKVTARPSSGSASLAGLTDTVNGSVVASILIDSAGVLSATMSGGTPVTGPTIDTTSWHVIEIQANSASKTLDWKVDGVLQTRATTGTTLSGVEYMRLGPNTTIAYTADFDDWIVGEWTVAATDWYGDGKVLAQLPASDGTHATITSLSPGDAGTAYSGTPTTVNTMVDDPPGTLGWTATRSATDNIALRTATVGAYAEIKPAVTAQTGQANAVRAIMSYSSSTTTANLAACDVRNSAGAVKELWGLTGGVGKAYNIVANQFKGAIVTAPAAGWTAAEVNAIRLRFGGCTSADISPVPTVQAMMLEVDWPIAAPLVITPAKPRVIRQAVNRAAVM
jgi:hypothetical protein